METNRYVRLADLYNRLDSLAADFFYPRLSMLGLYRGQPKVLRFLGEHDGCRQKDIAEHFYLKAASVSGTLSILEQQGLIERKMNPKSRRETLVYLTEAGKEKLIEVRKLYDAIDREWFGDFCGEDLERLLTLLEGLLESILERERV
ncbi:MAG: MarR family transcriptional regulator [Lachnospiraceae bacterium]|nr:MarR family transcriptional regulator [Lachnospiraceae bacterium]